MRNSDKSGYSFLEILIVMALTALTLVTLIGVFLKGQLLSKSGERITLCTDIGLALLERTRQLDFDLVPDEVTFSSASGQQPIDGFPPSPYEPDCSPAMTVETKLVSPTMKSVVVKLDYKPGHQVVLETYVRP